MSGNQHTREVLFRRTKANLSLSTSLHIAAVSAGLVTAKINRLVKRGVRRLAKGYSSIKSVSSNADLLVRVIPKVPHITRESKCYSCIYCSQFFSTAAFAGGKERLPLLQHGHGAGKGGQL